MPTFLSHPAIPLALGAGLGERAVSGRLLVAGIAASVLPDLDVVGFRLGIPYQAALGHRGATHSLAFAAAVALVGAALHRPLRARAGPAFAYLFAACASHGILDAFTSGGLGVALLWPFSDVRYFAPVRPIHVAPLGLHGLFTRGPTLLASELAWIWAPSAAAGLLLAWWRRRRGSLGATSSRGRDGGEGG
jgi:inner membrane protein